MPELSNTKTWTKTRLTVTGASSIISNKLLYVAIKNEMLNHGWSVVSSCDSSSVSLSDLWVDNTDLVYATSGNPHSWIVLQNDSVYSGYQVCIDLNYSDAFGVQGSVYSTCITPFSGGTTTDRPTSATSARLNLRVNYMFNATSGTTKSANVFTSSDHQCTRVYLYNGSSIAGFWMFDQLRNSPSWVTYPVIGLVNTDSCVHADFSSASTNYATGYGGGDAVYSWLGTLMLGTTRVLTYAGAANATGDVGLTAPCTPMWVISSSNHYSGILGVLYDLWWTHSSCTAQGDTFPAGGTRTQVVIGDMVQGNDGTAFTP